MGSTTNECLYRAAATGGVIPTCSSTISVAEVVTAVHGLKLKRAATDIPAEFLRALLHADVIDESCWLVKLMQLCWERKEIPSGWHVAKVIPIYKKGCPEKCDNYRPISLMSILYKLYVSILLRRLKAAGAECKLWSRQFGFRSSRPTDDALFIVSRRIEQAIAAKQGRTLTLALDWKRHSTAFPRRGWYGL